MITRVNALRQYRLSKRSSRACEAEGGARNPLIFPVLSVAWPADNADEFDQVRIYDSKRIQAFAGSEQVFPIEPSFPT